MTSRVARKTILLPKNVDLNLAGQEITIKGPKGTLSHKLPASVKLHQAENEISFSANDDSTQANALAGTSRALVNNIIHGVSHGYEIKLILVGVGYRAQIQGQNLNLTLGFSHPVKYVAPTGIVIETPSQTEVLIKGADKQVVGQVAANIRGFRPPEKYKGKGIRYSTEVIILKETKKK